MRWGDKYESPMEILWILGYWTGEELKACKRAIVGKEKVRRLRDTLGSAKRQL